MLLKTFSVKDSSFINELDFHSVVYINELQALCNSFNEITFILILSQHENRATATGFPIIYEFELNTY